MGERGPIPNRSDQRRRQNKTDIEIDSAPGTVDVSMPAACPEWTDAAKRWYASLAESGQAHWYEPSDWAQAWVLAEVLDRAMHQGISLNSQLITAWLAGAAELLTTEGARRRMRIELSKAKQADPDAESAVADLDEFRARFTS